MCYRKHHGTGFRFCFKQNATLAGASDLSFTTMVHSVTSYHEASELVTSFDISQCPHPQKEHATNWRTGGRGIYELFKSQKSTQFCNQKATSRTNWKLSQNRKLGETFEYDKSTNMGIKKDDLKTKKRVGENVQYGGVAVGASYM